MTEDNLIKGKFALEKKRCDWEELVQGPIKVKNLWAGILKCPE